MLADRQTHGNGRLGRSFLSDGGRGVYLSYLLRPDCDPAALSLLTSCAGLAVCQVLEQQGLSPAIKWPNDIILDRRKVCGILTKLTSDAESGTINGAVIGIGVNVTQQREDFPEELRDKAISVREAGVSVPRAAIAAGIITRLDDMFLRQHILSQPAEALIGELTRRSCTIGGRVEVISPTGQYEALAVGIAPDAGLIVELPDGTRRTVSSGEVSVRGLLGYTNKGASLTMSHPTERCELTNLCMITDAENRILVQDRTDPSWPGICFPGGHVEPGESFVASVIREVQEETGLTIQNPILCGVKQFPREDGARYVVLRFRATRFTGTLTSSLGR